MRKPASTGFQWPLAADGTARALVWFRLIYAAFPGRFSSYLT